MGMENLLKNEDCYLGYTSNAPNLSTMAPKM